VDTLSGTFSYEEHFMIQRGQSRQQRGQSRQQRDSSERPDQQHVRVARASRLLRSHPVLLPGLLLGGSLVLCFASFYANSLFPLLALLGAPTSLLCLSMAIVLGVSGVLASIISGIEGIDRHRLRSTTIAKSKGA
jgi:ABC-type Fe3+ transport system permease subunit